MIPTTILLPALSKKDRAEFDALCADYETAKAQVIAYSNGARIARKKELRDKLATAPHSKMLSIGAELETLGASFTSAKRGAKQKLRALSSRYVDLFPRLIDQCQTHANELIASAKISWSEHFAAFGAEPVGESPIVDSLVQWKKALAERRILIESMGTNSTAPLPPTSILPF